MKYKKFLLIAFFLALFVFQQAQASANTSQVMDALPQIGLLQSYDPPTMIYVRLWHLNDDGSRSQPYIECASGHTDYGCVAIGSGRFYPYDTNPALVDVENDYLLDVVPREMDPRFYDSTAVSAQAIAARSFAYYWNNQGFNLSNSTDSQVFVPYTFEQWLGPNYPSNSNTPCQSSDLNTAQQTICNAVLSRYYIAANNSDQPAKTEFSSDIFSVTQPGDQPYLQSVQDPISTVCDSLIGIYGNNRGMSQEGASRWARGNQCASGGDANTAWPVKWTDYRQILVHYYTGVDILNTGGGKVAPDDRWNLLWHNIPVQITSGQAIQANVWLQNTSTIGWTDAKLGYQWIDSQSNSGPWTEINLPSMPPSDDENILISIMAPPIGGTYTLRLDVKRADGAWFSDAGWIDAKIAVGITGPTPTATNPPVATVTPTAMPASSNYALRFQLPTSSQAILMPSATNLNFDGDMTIEFWIKTTSTYGGGAWHDGQWILDKDIGGAGRTDWAVVLRSGKIVFNNGTGACCSDHALYSVGSVNNGAWHHVAIVRNISTGNGLTTIYIDGIQDTSGYFSIGNLESV